MKRLKRAIQNLLNAIGYDIVRIRRVQSTDDIDLYLQIYGKDAVQNRRFHNIGAGSFRHSAWTNVDHESDWYKNAQGNNIVLLCHGSYIFLRSGINSKWSMWYRDG